MTSPGGRARQLLRAYPWRVRAEQGEEIVGTVLDALPPGAARLPVAIGVDLVRGGLAMRWNRRPPPVTVLRYRAGGRLGPEWLGWIRDDVDDPGFGRKHVLRSVLEGTALLLLALLAAGGPWVVLPASLPVQLLVARRSAERERARLRSRHGLTAEGPDPDVVWVQQPRPALVPDVAVARPAAAFGAALVLGGVALVAAVSHQRPRLASFPLRTPAPPDAISTAVPHLVVGAAVGAAAAAVGIAVLGRRLASPRPIPRARTTTAVAVAMAVLTTSLGTAASVRWQWLPWTFGKAGAVLAPAGLGLLVLASCAGLRGRRVGRAVGLWDVAPRLGPLQRSWPVSRTHEALVVGATRHATEGEDRDRAPTGPS